MTETATHSTHPFIDGPFLFANLPPAAQSTELLAYVSDVNGGCYMSSNGVEWRPVINRRVELYAGVTDASGNFSVVYSPAFTSEPHVNPVTYPPADSTTRVRVTAASLTGFTVKTERNAGVSILGIDVLLLGTSNVAGVPVRIAVVGQ